MILILSGCEISRKGMNKLQEFIGKDFINKDFIDKRNDGDDDILDLLNAEKEENETNGETEYLEDENSPQLSSAESTETKKSSTLNVGPLNSKEVYSLVKQSRYAEVISGEINEQNPISRYYRGIAYHVMAELNPTPAKRKLSYTKKAEADFKYVGIHAKDQKLKPKAILWHGITIYKQRFSPKSVPEIQKAFDYIQDNFPQTRYFNDSLLYSALTYAKLKEMKSAQMYLVELNKTDPEDKVYDIDYNRWLSPQEAVKYYSELFNLSSRSEEEVSPKLKNHHIQKDLEKTHTELALDRKIGKVNTLNKPLSQDIAIKNQNLKNDDPSLKKTVNPVDLFDLDD